MLHKRLRLIAVPVAAVTLPLSVAGFQASAAATGTAIRRKRLCSIFDSSCVVAAR
jgi:hypothetical protein